ncbi:MAG: M20/M25/M40 family metallo-hydrolase [Phycisphaerales bacterium]|nr:M20/M25/M40 family metallo-hydrolase [Phycisphaerales bacterium]
MSATALARTATTNPRALASRFLGNRRLLVVAVACFAALPSSLAAAPVDLSSYADRAARIAKAAAEDDGGWRKLVELCDDVGPRLSGSDNLACAVEWAQATMRRDGHENVRADPVTVPRWTRGAESLRILTPREIDIPMLGLGGSIGTPADGIEAEIVSVAGDEGLTALGDGARGKIVLFNVPMSRENERFGAGYGPAVRYRGAGATMAARSGAVAALIRSVTTRTLQSPHTGAMSYAGAPEQIPAAAISVEAAEMIARWNERGIPVRGVLKMNAQSHPPVQSANVLGELIGSEKPDEIVVISGHLDSWDVGQGASDDGGGVVTAMEALTLLRKLDLRPRRTIRVVLWTNEEFGLSGARRYVIDHKDEMERHVAAIESDGGVAEPIGFGVRTNDADRTNRAAETLKRIVALVPGMKLDAYSGYGGADISRMHDFGVAQLGLDADMTHYFDVHHTHADTVDKIDQAELQRNVAVMAVTAYILADMPGRLGDIDADATP